MKSPKLRQLKKLGLLLWSASLISCVTKPPDIPACTAFPAADYFKMRDEFYKLCGEDLVCKVNLASWKQKVATWTIPSDHGWCVRAISGENWPVDAKNPYPYRDINGHRKTWVELMSSTVMLPAKESWAPLKTFVQTNCRAQGNCGDGIGDWESTLKLVDEKLK